LHFYFNAINLPFVSNPSGFILFIFLKRSSKHLFVTALKKLIRLRDFGQVAVKK